jgi:hypothetical protein
MPQVTQLPIELMARALIAMARVGTLVWTQSAHEIQITLGEFQDDPQRFKSQ